jgi:small subunit ribosomal protein S17
MANVKNKDVARLIEGEVVSDKMEKSVVIKVSRRFKHPLIGKTIIRSKKYKVHDENNVAKLGDWVEVAECRPISKTKYMRLLRVIKSAS